MRTSQMSGASRLMAYRIMRVRSALFHVVLSVLTGTTVIGAQAIGETGRELFVNYCATCHGVDAKGQGPTASALKIRPPDLTMIAKKNGGIFHAGRIQSLVFGPDTFPSAHGSVQMPIWGPTFRRLDPSGDGQARFANR